MNCMLTGASGFIGSHLLARLAADPGNRIDILRSAAPAVETPLGQNVRAHSLAGGVAALDYADIDVVFHVGAIRPKFGTTREAYRAGNVDLPVAFYRAAASGGARRFVFVSSISVFGWPAADALPITDQHPYRADTLYGWSKGEAERQLRAAAAGASTKLVIVRPSIVYGPNDPRGMVTKLTELIAKGTYLTVGNGHNRVQLIYIDDVITALCLAAIQQVPSGEGFIVTGAQPITIDRLVRRLSELLDRTVPRLRIPVAAARVVAGVLEGLYACGLKLTGPEPMIHREGIMTMTRDRCYAIDHARHGLGFEPVVDYDEGLRRTVADYRRSRQ